MESESSSSGEEEQLFGREFSALQVTREHKSVLKQNTISNMITCVLHQLSEAIAPVSTQHKPLFLLH